MNYKVAKTMLLIMGKPIRHFSMWENAHICMKNGRPTMINTLGSSIPIADMDNYYKPTINSNAKYEEGWEVYVEANG